MSFQYDVSIGLRGHIVLVAIVVCDSYEIGRAWSSILGLCTLDYQTGCRLSTLYGKRFRKEVVRSIDVVLSLYITWRILESLLRDYMSSLLGSLIWSESLFGRMSDSTSAVSKVLMTLIPNVIPRRHLTLLASSLLVNWHMSFSCFPHSFQIFIDIAWFVGGTFYLLDVGVVGWEDVAGLAIGQMWIIFGFTWELILGVDVVLVSFKARLWLDLEKFLILWLANVITLDSKAEIASSRHLFVIHLGHNLKIARADLRHSELVQILLSLAHRENIRSMNTSLLPSFIIGWRYLRISGEGFDAKCSMAASIC